MRQHSMYEGLRAPAWAQSHLPLLPCLSGMGSQPPAPTHTQWMPPPSTSATTWAGCQGSACDLSTKWQGGVQGAHGGLCPPGTYLHSWGNMIFKIPDWKHDRLRKTTGLKKKSIPQPLAFCTRNPALLQFVHHPENYGLGPGWSSNLSRQSAFNVSFSWRASKKPPKT